jgi:TolB protein
VVYVQEVASGKRRALANFRGSNSAPAWSPDGQTLAVTLSRDGISQLYLMNRDGNNLRRLTNSPAIDTEPAFAPDGKGLYFVSDRGGTPQIYRTLLGGTAVERITFASSYNISPAISPDGRTMAYISRLGNDFRLHTLDLTTSGAQGVILTDTTDDESPSFSPNGRLIIYATRSQGRDVLMTTTLDGKIKARLISSTADVREPVWGPYGR